MNSRPARLSLVAMVAALTFCGASIAEDLLPPNVAEGLQAEVHAARPLFNPNGAIYVRFALLNASPETIAVPLSSPMAPNLGVALPNELALGSAESPAISIRFEDEPPVVVDEIPEWKTPQSRGARRLRIGPHGMVGTEIDLRRYYPRVRYPGRYVIEWRPFGDQLAVAQAAFRVEQRQEAIIVTDYGKMTFSLAYDAAPKNVNNFLELVEEGFYDGLTLHRVIPGFVIQGGCPKGDGTGIRPDGKLIEAEFHDAPVEIGTLLMARKPSDPNSASCQFFVALSRLEDLDQEYTVIGQADDDASVRTLQRIAGVPTNRQGEPIEPIAIRSVNLVNVEEARVYSLERDAAGEVDSTPKDSPAKKTPKKSRRSRK